MFDIGNEEAITTVGVISNSNSNKSVFINIPSRSQDLATTETFCSRLCGTRSRYFER